MPVEKKTYPVKRYPEFGARIRELMDRARMNGTELAAAADISISYPPKMRNGERPRIPILRRVAAALHADFDELAALAGYTVTDDRVHLPGWDALREADREAIRRLVAQMADLNRGQGSASGAAE